MSLPIISTIKAGYRGYLSDNSLNREVECTTRSLVEVGESRFRQMDKLAIEAINDAGVAKVEAIVLAEDLNQTAVVSARGLLDALKGIKDWDLGAEAKLSARWLKVPDEGTDALLKADRAINAYVDGDDSQIEAFNKEYPNCPLQFNSKKEAKTQFAEEAAIHLLRIGDA